jgi:hypothetical protein
MSCQSCIKEKVEMRRAGFMLGISTAVRNVGGSQKQMLIFLSHAFLVGFGALRWKLTAATQIDLQ